MLARSVLVLACLVAIPVACDRPERQDAVANPALNSAPLARACPLGVTGAHVEAVDTPQGIDLAITAPADRVDELRDRVRNAAKLYGAGAHQGLGHDGKHLGAQRHGLRLTELPPIETRVEDIAQGARLVVVARLPSQVDDLRSRLRARVSVVNAGPCD